MSCSNQTTPYDKKRVVFTKNGNISIINGPDELFHTNLSSFFLTSNDYITLDFNILSGTIEFDLPIESILKSGTLKNLILFASYEKTEYEAIECLQWSYDAIIWRPFSKLLAFTGTINPIAPTDISNMILPIKLRNLTPHTIKVKMLATN